MIIARSQMLSLSESAKREFDKTLALSLMRARPSETFPGFEAAVTFVRACIERGLGFGITSEAGLEQYVTASWILGGCADDRDEGIRRVLSNRELASFYRANESRIRAEQLARRPHG